MQPILNDCFYFISESSFENCFGGCTEVKALASQTLIHAARSLFWSALSCLLRSGSGQTRLQHRRQEAEKGPHRFQAPHPQRGVHALVPAESECTDPDCCQITCPLRKNYPLQGNTSPPGGRVSHWVCCSFPVEAWPFYKTTVKNENVLLVTCMSEGWVDLVIAGASLHFFNSWR